MTKPVYLVDSSIYIFRAWFSMPDVWFAPNGYSVNALYGYVLFWLKLLAQAEPEHIVAAYDESLGSCFRNKLYPDYKMSRALPDPELAFQLEACKGFTEMLGIPTAASDYYEADDIIATLAALAAKRRRAVVVVSRDKDLGQLIHRPQDRIWDFAADSWLDNEGVLRQFGVTPQQLPDYLALVGDKIDDIPGVPGVGGKTAAALLQRYGSVNGLYKQLDDVAVSGIRGARTLVAKLEDCRDQVKLSLQLATLHRAVPLDKTVRSMRWRKPPLEEVYYYLQEFGLGQRLRGQLEKADWWSRG